RPAPEAGRPDRTSPAVPVAPPGGVGLGKGRHQSQGVTERLLGLNLLAAEQEDGSLVAPEDGIVLLHADGAADDLLGQVEVARVGRLPGLVGQLARAAALLLFLFLEIHTIFHRAPATGASADHLTGLENGGTAPVPGRGGTGR